jgi:urease accessory protein UreH
MIFSSLESSSYTLCKRGGARQNAIFRLGEGSFLEYLPHYLISFSHSSYQQDTVFLLEGEAIKLTQLNVVLHP